MSADPPLDSSVCQFAGDLRVTSAVSPNAIGSKGRSMKQIQTGVGVCVIVSSLVVGCAARTDNVGTLAEGLGLDPADCTEGYNALLDYCEQVYAEDPAGYSSCLDGAVALLHECQNPTPDPDVPEAGCQFPKLPRVVIEMIGGVVQPARMICCQNFVTEGSYASGELQAACLDQDPPPPPPPPNQCCVSACPPNTVFHNAYGSEGAREVAYPLCCAPGADLEAIQTSHSVAYQCAGGGGGPPSVTCSACPWD